MSSPFRICPHRRVSQHPIVVALAFLFVTLLHHPRPLLAVGGAAIVRRVECSSGQKSHRPKNVRIPDSRVPATTLACLSTAPCSKTHPTIIVSVVESADGFSDTERSRHPAGQAFLSRTTKVLDQGGHDRDAVPTLRSTLASSASWSRTFVKPLRTGFKSDCVLARDWRSVTAPALTTAARAL
jgi:hypothetical protein